MIYLAGDMLNLGAQMQRASERDQLTQKGYKLYVPQDNASINDKVNLDSNAGLAERIVQADTNGIISSDIVVMEAREAALGTCCELGQIKGMRDIARMMQNIIDDATLTVEQREIELAELSALILGQKILIHNSDIRRHGSPTETGDRRAYGVHQYVYGLVLDVTNGVGYTEWPDIMKQL